METDFIKLVTREVIAELKKEAARHWLVALCVVFADSSMKLLASNDPGAEGPFLLPALTEMLKSGGVPIGLLAADREAAKTAAAAGQERETLTFSHRVYPPVSGEIRKQNAELLKIANQHFYGELLKRVEVVDEGIQN